MNKISNEKFLQLLVEAKKKKELSNSIPQVHESIVHEENDIFIHKGKEITYNAKQKEFISLVKTLQSCVLIGAAGTGKTTCYLGAAHELSQHPKVHLIKDDGHKHIKSGTPGVLFLSYTRRSVANDKRALPENLQANCMTIHKALEYAPVKYEVFDEETGQMKTTMRFEPQRTDSYPLDSSISVILISEASMVSVDLFKKLQQAAQHAIFIFSGDIQQLPPVFGSSILGYKMNSLPVIELTEVYRQAMDSPIIRLAHRILSGVPISTNALDKLNDPEDRLVFYKWKKKFSPEIAVTTAVKLLLLTPEEKAKVKTIPANILEAFSSYDPEEDMILCPFNKSFGTIEINKRVAQYLAKKRNATVWEIVAGREKHYFSIGDKILYDKEDAEIIDISRNGAYTGRKPQHESQTLDYWGVEHSKTAVHNPAITLDDIDKFLDSATDEEKVNLASHIITIRLLDSEEVISIDKAAEVNSILLSYALTVHKSQGSEYRKVFLMLHNSHSTMVQRELLYTAVTRARENLLIICEDDTFVKGITNQKIPGHTWQEKAEFFKGKKEKEETYYE